MPILPPAAASSQKPRRRWFVRIVVVVLLLAFMTWIAPVVAARVGLHNAVLARVFVSLNGTLTAGDASLSWLSPVELRDVTATDPNGRTALTAVRVTSSKTLFELATDSTDLGTFTIESPVLEVVCEPGTTNIEQAIANYLADDTPGGPERMGFEVKAVQGRIVLKDADRPGEQILEGVEGAMVVPRRASEPITLDVMSGTATVGVVLRDPMEWDISADRFALETVGPFVRRFVPGTVATGQLTTQLAVRIDLEADRSDVTVDGKAKVIGLDLMAPWLGEDRVRLQHADLVCNADLTGDELRVTQSVLTCDAGTVSFAGTVSRTDSPDELLARSGLKADADVDLAKLAAVVPKLLRLRPGTELREGRVTTHVASTSGPNGTEWSGTVETTALHGLREGKPLVWEKPLWAAFAGHRRPDGMPVFDKLQCRSDFVGLNAQGSPEQFAAAANLDLDRLSTRLAEFADLGGVTLAGQAEVQAQTTPIAGGGHALAVVAHLTRFALTDSVGRGIREPDMRMTVEATGALDPAGPVRIDAGTVVAQASGDELRVTLMQRVPDARTPHGGRLSLRATGDVARWQRRLDGVVALPKDWAAAGTGTIAAVVHLTEPGATADRVNVDLRDVRFTGAGMNVAEPTLTAEARGAWDRATGAVTFTEVKATCETAGVSARQLRVQPGGIVGTAAITANVARLQRAMMALPNDPLAGTVTGNVTFDAIHGRVKFEADLNGKNLVYGPAARPTWSEPWAKLIAVGEYDPTADMIAFRTLKLARDGFATDATGSVTQPGTVQALDLRGTLTYDLAKLEPTLRRYLGHHAEVAGKGTRPFQLAGRLTDTASVSMKVGGRPGGSSPVTHLSGTAAVAWQQVKAFGFEVGPAELTAAVDRGRVRMNPVEAAFGRGKVRLEPTVSLTTPGYDLTFAPGRVVEKARLTPEACADALGFALPAIAHAAQADGLVSFDLADNVVPLTNPTAASVVGKLTIHNAAVSPGPLVTEIAGLLGAKQTTFTLATEQVVDVRVKDGKVYHDNFALTFGQTTVKTAGAVGLDGSLSMVVDVPLPPRLLDKVPAKLTAVREALSRKRIRVPVGGTVRRPQLDPRVLDGQGQQMVQAAIHEAGTKLTDDLIQKGQEKLFQRLRDKLGPKLPDPKP